MLETRTSELSSGAEPVLGAGSAGFTGPGRAGPGRAGPGSNGGVDPVLGARDVGEVAVGAEDQPPHLAVGRAAGLIRVFVRYSKNTNTTTNNS